MPDHSLLATLAALVAASRDHLDSLPDRVRQAPYTRTFEEVLSHAEDEAANATWASVLEPMRQHPTPDDIV